MLETNTYSILTVSPYNKHFSFFEYNRKIFATYFPRTMVDRYAEIYSRVLTSTGIGSYVDREKNIQYIYDLGNQYIKAS